jgi:N4-gp56 family major capsid protein
MADPITDYYADNPVEVLDKNQRAWYDPDVLTLFKNNALFAPIMAYKRNLGDVRATSMTVSQILEPHANYNALTARQLWLPAMHIDSRSIEITFEHHGGKVALHEYDDLVTYWRANGREGLRSILNNVLGWHIIEVHDYLARNALLYGALATTGYVMYAGSATSFNDITSTDLFTPDIAKDIQLGMKYREVAGAVNPTGGSAPAVVCYTSPGVIYDIQNDEDWIEATKYADPSGLFRYEVGAIKNVRFVESPRLTMWNCGAVEYQSKIAAVALAGDGAPTPSTTKVDGVYKVGQESAGVTHYLQLSDTTIAGTLEANLQVNDIVSIHTARTSAFGVTNGVNPFDGKLHNRRVVSIDAGNDRIVLDKPIMEDFATDLGSTTYGYVTKAQNVHASIFIGAPNAIVTGVAAPIRLHTPPPIDDLEAIYRYSWNDRMGHQPYAPEVFEVVFSAGSTRVKGARQV